MHILTLLLSDFLTLMIEISCDSLNTLTHSIHVRKALVDITIQTNKPNKLSIHVCGRVTHPK